MDFADLASRITGVSLPNGFGVQFNPRTPERRVAAEVVAFLEPRAVLWSTYTNEVPEECVLSVIAIRDYLTEELRRAENRTNLTGSLRMMRGACVRFLQRVRATEDPADPEARRRRLHHDRRWAMHDYEFGQALGELRAGIGLQVALLAGGYGIAVGEPLAGALARVLPVLSDEDAT